MAQHYSNPSRAEDSYSLPDLEVWETPITIIRSGCGQFDVPRDSEWARGFCPSCDRATCVDSLQTFDPAESGIEHTDRRAWFYWFCFPGCLPDSDSKSARLRPRTKRWPMRATAWTTTATATRVAALRRRCSWTGCRVERRVGA